MSTCLIKGHGQMLASAVICVTACCLAQKGPYLVKNMRIEVDIAISTTLRCRDSCECSDIRTGLTRSKIAIMHEMHLTANVGEQSSMRLLVNMCL